MLKGNMYFFFLVEISEYKFMQIFICYDKSVYIITQQTYANKYTLTNTYKHTNTITLTLLLATTTTANKAIATKN